MFRRKYAGLRSTVFLAPFLLLALAPDRSEAASTSYVIDFSFPFDPLAGSRFGVQGDFLEAARFEIDSSLLLEGTLNFVPYAKLDAFSVRLPTLSLGQGEKNRGDCLTVARPPCGVLFVGMEPLTLVGQFSIADPTGRFSFRLDNTGLSFANPDPIFQSVSIQDLDPRIRATVASGFARIRQPVPEPSAMLLLASGGVAVGHALRRRRRWAASA
jgi:hypothetical protein